MLFNKRMIKSSTCETLDASKMYICHCQSGHQYVYTVRSYQLITFYSFNVSATWTVILRNKIILFMELGPLENGLNGSDHQGPNFFFFNVYNICIRYYFVMIFNIVSIIYVLDIILICLIIF